MSSTSVSASGVASQFTCNICDITFENNALQRTHAKSDWHIYNLKRHLTSLPPISFQVHNERVASISETSTADHSENESFNKSCTTCKKDYYSSKAYHNHLKSSNHAQMSAKLEIQDDNSPSPADITYTGSGNSDPDLSSCLFCPRTFPSIDLSMSHMQTTHNFSIPHQDLLFDLPSFIDYLSTLITTFQECLYCGQTRDTMAAIRQHMVDKGHCTLPDDAPESEEFEEFYDISDVESDEEDSDEKEAEKHTHKPLPNDTSDFHLPSGRTLIHRSQARSFRQTQSRSKVPTQKTIEAEANAEPSKAGPSNPSDRRAVMSLQRSENANKGLIGLPEQEKRAVRALEKKMMKMEIRARTQYQARVEKGGNKQKFFKPDVPGPKNG